MTFQGALESCEAHGGALAVLDSYETSTVIVGTSVQAQALLFFFLLFVFFILLFRYPSKSECMRCIAIYMLVFEIQTGTYANRLMCLRAW